MFHFKVASFSLLLVGISGNYFNLTELIQRIYEESASNTVLFIGVDDGFLYDFTKGHSNIPVAEFTTIPSDNNEKFHRNSAVLVIQSQDKRQFAMLEDFIEQVRYRKFVIISANQIENLQDYFIYFWEKKFTRIYGIAENISYSYLPYADNQIEALYKGDTIPHALTDLNGLAIRTTIQRDIPRTFWYPDAKGQAQIGGCFGQIIVNFLRRHNATFRELFLNNSTELVMPDIINATIENKIDISMNVYGIQPVLGYSYPVKVIKWVIMVPLNGYVDPNEYFLRPFTLTAWLCIGITLIYLVVMDVVKDIYIDVGADVWHSFSRIFLTMLSMCSDRKITTAYRFHVQVMLLAFILSNIYVIYFTSFLTVFIKVKQYRTMKDLIENNFPVLFPDFEWKIISDRVPELEKIVVLVDYETFYKARNSMDKRFAYALGADKAEFLIGLQAHFAKPLFHTTVDSLRDAHISFLLPHYSRFIDILSEFNMLVVETGLVQKWDTDAIVQARRAGYRLNVSRDLDPSAVSLTMDHLRFAWNCLAIGWTLAVIVLFGEIFGMPLMGFFEFCKNKIWFRKDEYLP